MHDNKQFITRPTKEDLKILFDLIKIEVTANSFHVHYSLAINQGTAGELDIFIKVFPIRFIRKFFKVNSKMELKYIVNRPEYFLKKPKD